MCVIAPIFGFIAKRTLKHVRQLLFAGIIRQTNVDGGNDGNGMVHTAVPITDEKGAIVHRLFIYSEKLE